MKNMYVGQVDKLILAEPVTSKTFTNWDGIWQSFCVSNIRM